MLHNRSQYYCDVITGANASQITSLTVVYSTVYSGADQRKHKSSASLAFVRGIHRRSVNSPHKWPVTRKMFPFDDVTMNIYCIYTWMRIKRMRKGKWEVNPSPPSAAYMCQRSSIGSGNGLSPVRRQAITWTNTDLLSIAPLGTNFNEIRIKIQNFLFKKMRFETPSAKWRPFCPGRDALRKDIVSNTTTRNEAVWIDVQRKGKQRKMNKTIDDGVQMDEKIHVPGFIYKYICKV